MTTEQEKQWREEFIAIKGEAPTVGDGYYYWERELQGYLAAKQSSQSIIDAQAQEIEELRRKLAEIQAVYLKTGMPMFMNETKELNTLLFEARKQEREDYEEVLTDHRRLVRELDVALNGIDGAAKQASLCDIVGSIHMAINNIRKQEREEAAQRFLDNAKGCWTNAEMADLIRSQE